MKPPPLEIQPDMLAAWALKASQRLAFAQLAPNLTIVQVSPNFGSLFSMPDVNLAGTLVTEVLEEFMGMEEVLLSILQGDMPSFELQNINREQPDGRIVYLTFLVTPLDDNRPEDGLLLLVENATDHGHLQRKLVQDRNQLRLLQERLATANEDLKKLSKMKSLFLSMAAHDLRSPLSAISGYADLLLDGEIDELTLQQQEFLSIIRAQANRMSRLTFDLLNLDQIERGQLRVMPITCSVRQLIQEVIGVSRIEAKLRGITLHCTIPDTPLEIWAEPDRVLQILYNLLGNALKYTKSGGVVSISATEEKDEVRIEFSDSGPGMTPEQLRNLFKLYYRTEDAQRSQIKGTGLGLFIVKSLVDAHQGRITVESRLNTGTTFTVWLPKPVPLDP
jgi:signal transduction histidine kinase